MRTLKTLFILINLLFLIFSCKQREIKHEKPLLKNEIEIEISCVKDQEASEACWSYATVSFLESELMRKGFSEMDFSEMYYVRQMLLQRGSDYIKYKGNLHFGLGGHTHDVMNQINEYGAIPQQFYIGNEYNPEYMDLSELDSVLIYYLKDVLINKKENWIDDYTAIVEKYLGKVPEEFVVNESTYSPLEFYQSLDLDVNDYIELTSYNKHPFYEPYVLEIPDNWSKNKYINVPLEDFFDIMENSIRNGYSFVWNGDVLNEGFYYFDNICIAPDDESKNLERNVTQEYRQKRFDEHTVEDEHLVHVIGLAKDEKGNLYFKSKNSWGTADVFYGGYQYMSEQYLKLFTISMLVHKDAIPKDIKKKLGI